MTTEATTGATLVQVRLSGVPLRIRARALEHDQDLLREFALVRLSADIDGASSVPSRLLDLADQIRGTYGGLGAVPDAEMEAAADRGEATCDVVYVVPVELRPLLHRAARVLEEAEEFCREGRYLLTLAAPPDVAAYREWIFAEFDRQIAGGEPIPWSQSPASRRVTGA